MNRFWIFPLILAFVGGLLPLVVLCETVLPLENPFLSFSADLYGFVSELIGDWQMAAPYGVGFFVTVGFALAVFDWIHNGPRHRSVGVLLSDLIDNLWWCSLYITIVIALNTALFWFVFSAIAIPTDWSSARYLSPAMAVMLSVIGVLWASIRTITSEDILSPRVLSSQLKRSVHLTG